MDNPLRAVNDNFFPKIVRSAETRGKKHRVEIVKVSAEDFFVRVLTNGKITLMSAGWRTLAEAEKRYTLEINTARVYDGINYIEK